MNTFVKNNSLLIKNKTIISPILWLDAEDSNITTVSGLVSQWSDKSGNNYNATQSIIADRPTYNTTITPRKVTFFSSDRLFTTLPSIHDGVMILGTTNGTAAYRVIIPSGQYTIGKRGGAFMPDISVPDIFGQVILPSSASSTDIEYWINYIRSRGAGNSYGNVTNFAGYWRTWDEIKEFPLIDTSSGINFSDTWNGCTNLTIFPSINTSQANTLTATWLNCISLYNFPSINTSNVTNFRQAWQNCSSLTTFPSLNTNQGTNFNGTWRDCLNLNNFPSINTSNGTIFDSAWYNCRNLTSFPLLNVSKSLSFNSTWRNCVQLTTFPPNFFNNCLATNFSNSFIDTKLSQTSIDNILVSINSNNTSNGIFNQNGGSVPSATGQAAITSMRNRGWTITITGGF